MTGGSGVFGTWLIESFACAQRRLGFKGELWILCRDPRAWAARFPHLAASPSIHVVQGDLAEFQGPAGSFHGLIHAAVATERPVAQFRSMVGGTNRVLDFADACGADRLLFTSSGAVYGQPPRTLKPFPEDTPTAPDPCDPATAYGQGKRASEFLFAAYAREHSRQAVLARCFTFVGPHLALDTNFAIGNFIGDVLQGNPVRIKGDGTPLRSYLYLGDLAAWLWTLYFRGPSCRPVHVGSDQPVSIGQVAEKVVGVLRPATPIILAEQPREGIPPQCYVPETRIAREELGLEPWTPLDEAIRRTADWHHFQGDRPR